MKNSRKQIGLPFRQKDRPGVITCKLASAQDFREVHVKLASHADVLRGLSRVPALFGGKNSFREITAVNISLFVRWKSFFFHPTLSS